ncbi:sulfurtransferase complex subunit TusC [Aliikangiella sp. IMCC44359]|uniref:sulfurtransferase complex subunit TusC n=1 Tax=Aliikangiella sp. IMCC44359 TaxID=3459125 RepID=UPI00403AC7CF
MKSTTTTIIINSPPFGMINGKEGIDLALVCTAFDQNVYLIFSDEGIFHLLNNQNTEYFNDKNHDKLLKAIEFYDIDKIYVEQESLQRHQLVATHLIDKVELTHQLNIAQMCQQSQHVVIF